MVKNICRNSEQIDWGSSVNQWLFNPRMPREEQQALMQAAQAIEGIDNHFWVATSGSTGKIKWTALSKEAVLCSAAAVNRHLQSARQDSWLNPLPLFHVAGLGIAARAFLSGVAVTHTGPEVAKWDPHGYMEQLQACQATLTALVPAQLHDLVMLGKPPPRYLRAVIVGGGRVHESIYFKAVEQGWPILLSYGLTECCSQVATSELNAWHRGSFPKLKPLDHVQIEPDEQGYLKIRSAALLTGYLEYSENRAQFTDPKREGWFHTQDIAELQDGWISALRREDRCIKIGGESVDLARLERILEEERSHISCVADMVLWPMPDEKLGYRIHLVADAHSEPVGQIVERFNARVYPFERIRQIECVEAIPRSPLKKLCKQELLLLLKQTKAQFFRDGL